MKRVELKRIAECLWKGSPADEKTPFAAQGMLPDNGSFSKNLEADDNKKAAKEFPEDEGENVEGPMSIPRKLCFVMSFNVWILYFLVLGWLLPCRHPECALPYPENIKRSLSSIWPLADVEPMNGKGLPSLAMLGYADGKELKLAALASFDATFEWNNSLPFIPRKIQCNFENTFDANEDGIPDCLLSGFNDVYAFNASNGYVFWLQNLPSEAGNILSRFHTMAVHNETYLIGTCGDQMVVLDSRTGNKTVEADLPCDSPFKIQIVKNPIDANFILWSLVCDYGDKVEAWGFGDRDVLSGGNLENNATEFALLYSGSSSDRSIDLGCDVTPVPGGPLLLSWSNRVVMVTREATAWEQHFPYPFTVAAIAVGSFSRNESQVAAAVHNGTDSIVVVMRGKDGKIIDHVILTNRQVQSMEKMSGDTPFGTDLLLLKSRTFGVSTPPTYNFSDPIPTDRTNFVVVDFHKTPVKIDEIATESTVLSSALNRQTNGETDLLVIKTENGNTTYQKYVLHGSDAHYSLCHGNDVRHKSS